MVLEVNLVDVISVGDVFLFVFGCHGTSWAVHHPVQVMEKFASLDCSELWAWLM